jgi:glucose/arabinose dehydrogenase
MKKPSIYLLGLFLLLVVGLTIYKTPKDPKETSLPTQVSQEEVKIIAENLQIPWEIVFLPDGDLLVTERSGNLLRIGEDTKTIAKVDGVKHVGEGGLLGLALHPNFKSNNYIYLYSTTQDGSAITNRVERYTLIDNFLSNRVAIIQGIGGSRNHNGGRIAFGPDGYLYITTGDAEEPNLAQDTNSLEGKILRLTDEGKIPEDNPFENEVYSYGHRNPQGLAWDQAGNLWATEHGPSGLESGYDEVNQITKGGNYGWPLLRGEQVRECFVSPYLQSGKTDTWAPAGLIYLGDNLFFAGLRGQSLYQLNISTESSELIPHLNKEFGRLRAIALGPDGYLYISTSNRDGRGLASSGDDKIIKINPEILFP